MKQSNFQLAYVSGSLGLLALAGCGGGLSDRPNVLLITVDTLRADVLGAYGNPVKPTPRIDALAAQGTRFDRAYTVTPLTIPAHSSIHTGLLPPRHGVRDNGDFFLDDGATTLAERVRSAGYATMAAVGAEVTSHHWGFAQGFDDYFDQMGPARNGNRWAVERRGDQVVADADAWFAGKKDSGKPFFAWVHLFDVHHPYVPPEPYRTKYASNLYQGEVAWTDSVVGRLLDGLKSRGQLNNTWVVLLADHGEGLGSHGEALHGVLLYDATTRIPMVIQPPQGVSVRSEVDVPVSSVDVTPTILGLLGLQVPAGLDGVNLAPVVRGSGVPDIARSVYVESLYAWRHYGWAQQRATVHQDWKWIDSTTPELYHRDEVDELVNRASSEPVVAQAMRLSTEVFRRIEPVVGAVGEAEASAERTAQLEALGYLSGGEAPKISEGLPDPVGRLPVLRAVELARMAIQAGDSEGALKQLTTVIAADPGLVEPRQLRAQLRAGRGQVQEALAEMEAVVAEKRSGSSLTLLATLRLQSGDHEGGFPLLDEAIAMDPTLASSRIVLLRALAFSGEATRFVQAAQDAHSAIPEDPELRGLYGLSLLQGGDPLNGEAEMVSALSEKPVQPLITQTLGLLRLQQGRYGEAETLLLDEVASFPPAIGAREGLVRIFAEQRRYTEQLAQLEALASVRVPTAVHLHAQAQALFNLRRFEEARALLRDAIAQNPEFAQGYLLLANAEKKLGQLDAAQNAYQRAQTLRQKSRSVQGTP